MSQTGYAPLLCLVGPTFNWFLCACNGGLMVLTTSRLTCPSVLMSVDTAYSDQQIVFPIFITLGKVYSSGLFLFSLIHACYAVFQPCDLCSTDSQFICLLIYQVFMLSALFWHTLPMIIIFYQSSLTIDSLNRSRALSLGLWIAFSGSSFVAGFFLQSIWEAWLVCTGSLLLTLSVFGWCAFFC
jgi:hypothetical protein